MKNEVVIHGTTWVNLENIMQSERSQAQRTTYFMIPFKMRYGNICICTTDSLCYKAETNTPL